MRPTQLGFRSPNERTAELNTELAVTKEGAHYDVVKGSKQNPKGTNLPRADRFTMMSFYCKGSG
jgi:hypothetical protein